MFELIAHLFLRSPIFVSGHFKVNLEWPFWTLKFENLENEISVWIKNWKLKPQVLKPKFENHNSRLLSKRAIIN